MQESKKGQYFSFDAIMATLVFLLAVSLLSNYWFGVRASAEKGSDAYKEALRISDALLGDGSPPEWQTGSQVYSYGLAQSNGTSELNMTKAKRFFQQLANNYTGTQAMLRTNEQLIISIDDISGNTPSPLYFGGHAPQNPTTAVKAVRIATIYDSTTGKYLPVRLTITLWDSNQ